MCDKIPTSLGGIAQLGEHLNGIQGVMSSSLTISSKPENVYQVFGLFSFVKTGFKSESNLAI